MELNSQKVRALAPENDPLKIGMVTPPVFPAAKTSFPGPASQILLNHLNMDLPSPQENTSALSGFLTGSLWIHFVFV